MDNPDSNCDELTASTAAVIDNDILQVLFVSTQQNNLELCVEYAVRYDGWYFPDGLKTQLNCQQKASWTSETRN